MQDACLKVGLYIILVLLMAVGCEDNSEPDNFGERPDTGALRISPGSATLDTNDVYVAFSVSGGTDPYRWSVSDDSLGGISNATSAVVTYTRTAGKYGVNVLTVEDKQKWTAVVLVTQVEPDNE
ncbi:MAG: hypothetical protein EOM20_08545 [Spartobacteria bacterium]|nr:hypothetical protein [Spartobacteria bacterium]